MKYILGGILGVIILGGIFLLIRFNWQECIKVGHSTAYCILHLGK